MKKFILIDLFNGSFNNENIGHEIFNQYPNEFDGRYYGYIPPLNTINLKRLGAKNKDEYVDDILVIFTQKLDDKKVDRIITGYYPSARIYKKGKIDKALKRNKDGYDVPYLIESDVYIEIQKNSSMIIECGKYNSYMLRGMRYYSGGYPDLDSKILKFIEKQETEEYEEDENQKLINTISGASSTSISEAPKRKLIIKESKSRKYIQRDIRLSKSALIKSEFKCEVNEEHKTFLQPNGNSYMEGHHLIPCTEKNSIMIFEKYKRNIDCVENIVCLCPNCHRAIHFGDKNTKKKIIDVLYEKRNNELSKVGIKISKKELYEMYGL